MICSEIGAVVDQYYVLSICSKGIAALGALASLTIVCNPSLSCKHATLTR